MPSFQDLLDLYAFHAFEKQTRFASLVGEHDWLLDTEAAKVTFNDDMVFSVHYLGTESEITNTWLWADSNDNGWFPDHSLEFCRKVRAIGRDYGLNEFINDTYEFVDEVGKPTGHTLAMVSSCLGTASCYYRGPHDNGAVYFAITDRRIDLQSDLDRDGFHEAFTNLMWEPGNLKKRVISYLSDKGHIDPSFDGQEITCKLHTGEKIGLYFRETKDGGMEIGYKNELN